MFWCVRNYSCTFVRGRVDIVPTIPVLFTSYVLIRHVYEHKKTLVQISALERGLSVCCSLGLQLL